MGSTFMVLSVKTMKIKSYKNFPTIYMYNYGSWPENESCFYTKHHIEWDSRLGANLSLEPNPVTVGYNIKA